MTDITDTVTQTGNGWWQQNGGQINRLERIFAGAARASDGSWPNLATDWLTQVTGHPIVLTAVVAALSPIGDYGIVAASRTSDKGQANTESCIPFGYFAINDDAVHPAVAYGTYGEAHHKAGALLTFNQEHDIFNESAVHGNQPYAMASGGSAICQWLASGGPNDATLAIGIINNGAKFKTGIMFGKDALTGCDGSTGTGEAIAMAKGHYLSWYGPTGAQLATIIGSCSTTPMQIVLGDGGISLTHNGQLAVQTHQPATGETGMLLAVNRSGTVVVSQVKLGATGSGGSGKRALVVDN